MAAEDPLEAEVLAAAALLLPGTQQVPGIVAELFRTAMVEAAGEHPCPETAALLRALAAVAPPELRRTAVDRKSVV